MTTQKITSTLNAAGFKAFRTYAKNVDGVYTKFTTGDFNAFKVGNMVGVETYGKQTNEIILALLSVGIYAQETAIGSGMIKIA